MGCSDSNSVNDGVPRKQYHEMTEEEKEKVKKEIEEQDKNLNDEGLIDEDPKLYEMYNWDELNKKLPVRKTAEDRKKRLQLWNKINEYGNGYVSFKRLSFQLDKYLKLPNVVKKKVQ